MPDHAPHDLWWKNAIVYCLDVETYLDSNGDGIGNFAGLTERLDHLEGLGINCVWLMPFYPTPNRDDGYDITDYYGIDSRLGDFGQFTEFVHAARARGIRVIADLVVNHTSNEHPWFQSARQGPESRFHDYYVWRDEPPQEWRARLVFPGQQTENWTFDEAAGRYYLHHFYRHQPDLNLENPHVRNELKRIVAFWQQQDISGFRVDAVPHLVETEGLARQLDITPHGFLRDLAGFLHRRRGDAILLGEVNLAPKDQVEFFGDGDQLTLIFNFYVNQYLHLALARANASPVKHALESLPPIPPTCQWANFLTNHDELTLDQLTDSERAEVFGAFGPEPHMQIFGRGLRRRLPSMLAGDTRKLQLAYSLLFSLPGTPVLFYGEEIGMGENLDVEGRGSVRTPMQWKPTKSGGFSTAPPERLRRPLTSGQFGPEHVNVSSQMRDPQSFLGWMQRTIRRRRQTPELGMGRSTVLDVEASEVLAHRCDWAGRAILALHNFSDRRIDLDLTDHIGGASAEVIWSDATGDANPASPVIEPFGFRWLRLRDPEDGLLL